MQEVEDPPLLQLGVSQLPPQIPSIRLRRIRWEGFPPDGEITCSCIIIWPVEIEWLPCIRLPTAFCMLESSVCGSGGGGGGGEGRLDIQCHVNMPHPLSIHAPQCVNHSIGFYRTTTTQDQTSKALLGPSNLPRSLLGERLHGRKSRS